MESTAFSALRGSFMVSTSVCLKSAPRAKSLVDGIEGRAYLVADGGQIELLDERLDLLEEPENVGLPGTERQLLLSLGETLQQDPQPFDELLWIEGLHGLVDPLQRSQSRLPPRPGW